MAKKRTATKKTAKTAKKATASRKASRVSSSTTLKSRYVSERESFFVDHPRAKYLLGALIVAFVFYLAHLWYVKQLHVQIGEVLGAEGIEYYPDLKRK